MKINLGKRTVAALLCLAIIVGFLPAGALSAGNDAVDYLMLATDRHENSTIIGTLLSRIEGDIGDGALDYVGLGGDMVNQTNSYNSSTVLGEVTAAADHMTSANVDLLYAAHDENCTDDAGIMNLASGLWMTLDQCYVYGIIQSDVEDTTAAQLAAANFTKWVSSLTDDKAIIVLSHFPLHAKRGDNLGAGYWHNALNAAATGSADGTNVIRNVAFFHGHNHTVDETEYYYAPGQTVSIESYVSPTDTAALSDTISMVYDTERAVNATAEGTNATVYYTYATAGYLNANGQATLVTVSEDSITFAKYASGSEPVTLGTVERAVATVNTVGGEVDAFTDIYATGLGLAEMDAVYYSEADLTELYGGDQYYPYGLTLTGYTAGEKITITVHAYEEDLTDAVVYVFEDLADGQTASYTMVECATAFVDETEETPCYTVITFQVDAAQEITFSFGLQNIQIPDGYALTELAVTSQPSKIKYFVEETNAEGVLPLDIAGLEITATYSDGVNSISKKLDWDQFGEIEDGYALSVDMTRLGLQDVQVSYTYGDVTKTATFSIWIGQEYFNQSGATVQVENPGTTAITVTDDITAAGRLALAHLVTDYVVYNITLTSVDGKGLDGGSAWVTLPVPAGVTKPVVYYVSDNGLVTLNMNATVNDDNTVTFETDHFSTYVVGQDTSIDMPEPTTAKGTGTTVTTTKKTVYVLTSSISAGNSYLIANSKSASSTTRYLLANNNGSVAATGVTIKSGDVDGDGDTEMYIELDDATDELWTVGSGYTFKNGSYYLGYTTSGDWNQSYSFGLSTTSCTWSYSTNNNRLSTSVGSRNPTTYYLRYNSEWTWSRDNNASGRNIYFYVPTEVETTTTTPVSGIYSIVGLPATVSKIVTASGITATLGYTKMFTPEGGTATTDIPDSVTFGNVTYAEVEGGDPNEIITVEGNTVTFTGNVGKALVKVSATVTTDDGEKPVDNYIQIEAIAPIYDLAVSAPQYQVAKGKTLDLTAIPTLNGTALSGQTITWSSSNEAVATVDANGVVTGVANGDVTITATWTDPDGVKHTDSVTLSVVDAIYDLDLCQPTYTLATEYVSGTTYFTESDGIYTVATDVTSANFASGTYYTQTTESITAPIIIKDVTSGQEFSDLWAVITADGVDLGKLTDAQLEKLTYVSSDESIATVDKTTGHVTFKGGTGTVTITAAYEYAEGKSVTDTVIISVSDDHYYVPEDGTNDFPDYPNQGSIRFDKNATAVGNFSQTGITKVELSMTGVPYSTGNEIDVVVMLDMTGSMSDNGMTAAEEATVAFVEKIVKNEDGSYNDNRVAVYAFNSGSSSPYELVALSKISSDTELTAANTAIRTASTKQASGGTPYEEATKQCYDVLQAAKTDGTGNDRQQFCVFMSDGGPTTYYGSDQKTYYGGNGNSGDVTLTSVMSGYSSSTSTDWKFSVPTEYYTDQLKEDGVTVYTVGLMLQTAPSNPAPYSSMTDSTYDSTTDSLTTIGSHYYFCSSILKQMASDESKYIDIFNVDNASKATAAFENIAKSMLDAAKNVKVEDKISDDFTMVFDAPNPSADAADGDQEYYIEVKEYNLIPVYSKVSITAFASGVTYYTLSGTTYTKATSYTAGTQYYIVSDYQRDTAKADSLMKLYAAEKTVDGAVVYYAASDASGTAHAAPTFDTTALGTKYFWTTTDISGNEDYSGVSVTVSGTTYYFDPKGKANTDEDWASVSSNWYNMTDGAYASGTKTTEYGKVSNPIADNKALYYVKDGDSYTKAETFVEGTEYYVASTVSQDLIIATEYFVYNAATKMLVWTTDKLQSSELALSYFLYLDNSAGWSGAEDEADSGSYETNDYANLTYENFQETDCKQEMPVPQITWNGAQVSYVFYLVNKEGQPVNRAGKVVPFSEAVYVTDVFTYSIVWNDLEQIASLEAGYLASELVPDVYSLFDSKASYDIHVFEDEEGQNLNNHFVIGGNKSVKVNTTYVFNTKAGDKYSVPGTYAAANEYKCKNYVANGEFEDEEGKYNIVTKDDATAVATGFDFANTTVAFAVLWEPHLVEDVVVVDFGLPVEINVIANDSMTPGVAGVRTDAPSGVVMNSGTYDTAAAIQSIELELDGKVIGTAMVVGLTTVRFEFNLTNGMQFTEPITFYYESKVEYYLNNTLNNTHMYSSVTIIPATTIYYEDSFVTTSSYEWKDNDDGVTDTNDWVREDTNSWTTVGNTVSNATQAQDRPGPSKIGAVYDADNLYGYDAAYKTMTEYSLGSAQKITVDSDHMGTAEFTFYGTGFDVISLTSNQTGTIIVDVYDAAGNLVKKNGEDVSYVVDTYYGYTAKLHNVTYTYANGVWSRDVGVESDADGETQKETPKGTKLSCVERQLYDVTYSYNGGAWEIIEQKPNYTAKQPVAGDVPENPQSGDGYVAIEERHAKVTYTYQQGWWSRAVTEITTEPLTTTAQKFKYQEYVWTVTDDNDPDTLYQVPVMKVFGLGYGKYTAKITVIYEPIFDHEQYEDGGSYDFYLDAIRIYDPAMDSGKVTYYGKNEENVVQGYTLDGVYALDGEGWPHYQELRDNVIEKGKFTYDSTIQNGLVFIDGNPAVDDAHIADYVSYGPNNELYLAKDQAVAFSVAVDANVADVQLGIKAANLSGATNVTFKINGTEHTVASTTDMYYSIKNYAMNDEEEVAVVTIQNTSGGVLSLTNIKVTYESDPNAVATLMYVDQETVDVALMMLRGEQLLSPPVIDWPALEQPEEPGFFETVFGGIGDFFANLFDSLFGWIFA